jgi:hypothetical protein
MEDLLNAWDMAVTKYFFKIRSLLLRTFKEERSSNVGITI